MSKPNRYTHCQVAQTDTQAKTCQKVYLFIPATDRQSVRRKNTERTTAVGRNSGCSASYDSFVVGSSSALRLNFCAKNPPLLQAAKR
jgi:hypothetical protein